MIRVLNAPVKRGDMIAYSVRKYWEMATRIGVIIRADSLTGSLLVRVVKSSDGRVPEQLVWLTELDRVVKLTGGIQ